MRKDRGVIPWLVYAGLRLVCSILYLFPLEWNLRTARRIGQWWWHLIPRHRDRARAHLRLAYGDALTDREVDRIALRSMQHLVMLAFEMAFAPRLIDEWTWPRYVRPAGIERALEVLLNGRGALLLTGHYGNWELAGFLLAALGFPVVAIMRPLDNAYINEFVVRTRQRRGLRLLAKKGASAYAESVIQEGAVMGFIADQNAGHKGIFVDFFGTPASTYKSIGVLAIAMEIPIIVGYARRVGDTFFYEVGVERIICPHEWQAREDALRWITQEYTSAIEAIVRAVPEQYLWIHRRWKSRPRNERVHAPRGSRGAPASAAIDPPAPPL